jgi:hypothetical protein
MRSEIETRLSSGSSSLGVLLSIWPGRDLVGGCLSGCLIDLGIHPVVGAEIQNGGRRARGHKDPWVSY